MTHKSAPKGKRPGRKPRDPKVITEGHRQLFVLRGACGADVARAAGVSEQVAGQWRCDGEKPNGEHREALRRAYGIEPGDWDRVPFRDDDPDRVVAREPQPPKPIGNGGEPSAAPTRAGLITELQSMLETADAKSKMGIIERLARMVEAQEKAESARALRLEEFFASEAWCELWQLVARRLDDKALEAVTKALGEVIG